MSKVHELKEETDTIPNQTTPQHLVYLMEEAKIKQVQRQSSRHSILESKGPV